jgi:hypothetical protein
LGLPVIGVMSPVPKLRVFLGGAAPAMRTSANTTGLSAKCYSYVIQNQIGGTGFETTQER